MPAPPKQRKMAIVGSRSVGEWQPLDARTHSHDVDLQRQVVTYRAICRGTFRGKLLSDH